MSGPFSGYDGARSDFVRQDAHGAEFTTARALSEKLGYGPKRWSSFLGAMKKAMQSCAGAGHRVEDHFREIAAKNARGQNRRDYTLTRLAMHRVIQAADPALPEVARAQDKLAQLAYRQNAAEVCARVAVRLELRGQLSKVFKQVSVAAKRAGVERIRKAGPVPENRQPEKEGYRQFFNAGYMALYDGKDAAALRAQRGLPAGADLYDYMGAQELSVQCRLMKETCARLRLDRPATPARAIALHAAVARDIRSALETQYGPAFSLCAQPVLPPAPAAARWLAAQENVTAADMAARYARGFAGVAPAIGRTP